MKTDNGSIKYEQAVGRIEEIVAALEKNDIPLDESLELFEEGTKLIKICTAGLNEAKAKITEIEENEQL